MTAYSDNNISTINKNKSNEIKSATGRTLSKHWLRVIVIIWSTQAISILTSGAAGWGIIWHVTQTTESALMLSLITVCAMLPQGLLSPFGGVAADKFNRKFVMIIADFGSGIASLVLAIIMFFGDTSLWLIMLFGAIRSIFGAFHAPAILAAMPMLVPEKHLTRVNSLDQVMGGFSNICSPAIGIALYTLWGLPFVLVIEFFGAVCAVIGLLFVSIPTVYDKQSEGRGPFLQFKDGWIALCEKKGITILLGGITVSLMFYSAMCAVYPLMAYSYFGVDGTAVSIMEAITGTAMLAGALLMVVWGGGKHLVRVIGFAGFGIGVSLFICGLLPSNMFVVYVVLLAFEGVFSAFINGPMMTIIQTNVPEEKNGRALGFLSTSFGISMPIGVAIGGSIAEITGIPFLFAASGIVICILSIALFAIKSVRNLDNAN